MNEEEKKHSTLPVIKGSTQEKTVTVIKGQGSRQARSTFTFDNVFTAFSTQEEVFNATLQPMIRDVMKGYESTIFAYGQTGTGKTHTMEGSLSTPELYGVIPRTAKAIFEAIEQTDYSNAIVKCSYLEIYNEELGDLLLDCSTDASSTTSSPTRRSSRTPTSKEKNVKLEIMEGSKGPFCRGLSEKQVDSYMDVLSLMQQAQQSRKTGETKMNKLSSRSHCIFTIKVQATRTMRDDSTLEFSGKLHMVDLAGSECAKTAKLDKGSVGEMAARERERMNINRSLLTLGRVIKLLKDQHKKKSNARIPYRDSRLTRMLQESLGGRCKTVIVATLSPSATAIEESMSTLNYAQSANGIVNKPISNSYMSISSMNPGSLGSDMSLMGPNAVDTWQEMECRLEYMQAQVEEAQAALARKHLMQQEFIERAEKAELDLVGMEKEVEDAKEEIATIQKEVEYEQEQRERISALQKETKIALQKTTLVLEATQHTESCLTEEAQAVLSTLEESIQDGEQLHKELLEARQYDIEKRAVTRDFHKATGDFLHALASKLDVVKAAEGANKEAILQLSENGSNREKQALQSTMDLIGDIKNDVQKMTNTMESLVDGKNGMKEILDNTTTKTAEKTQITLDGILEGEDQLAKAFSDAKERLELYSGEFKSADEDFLSLSQTVNSSIDARLVETQEKISKMVSSISEALGDVRETSTNTRNHLDSILRDIMKMSISSCTNMIDTSLNRRKALDRSLEKFVGAVSTFNDMNTELDGQERILSNEGGKHVDEIDKLKELLCVQNSSFQKAEKDQEILQNQFIANVYAGVKDLIDSEMLTLSEAKARQFKTFCSENEVISSVNNLVDEGATDIFSKIKAKNVVIREQVQEARDNDDLMVQAVQEASSTFTELEGMTKTHQVSLGGQLDTGFSDLEEMVQQSKELGTITEDLQGNGNTVDEFVAQFVRYDVQNGLTQLSDGATKISSLAIDTVLPKISDNVKAMEMPRGEWKRNMVSTLEDIKSGVEEEKTKLGANLREQIIATTKLATIVTSKNDSFVNIEAKSRSRDLLAHQKAIKEQIENFASSQNNMVSSCSSTLATTHDDVDDFAMNKIQYEKQPREVADKKVHEFSYELTATPSAERILRGVDFREESNEESSSINSIKDWNEIAEPDKEPSDNSVSASLDESMVFETVASDATSVTDSHTTLSSFQIPHRVGEVSLEKENVVNKKKKVVAAQRSKKRSSSNSRVDPTRKRMPAISTPIRTGNSARNLGR